MRIQNKVNPKTKNYKFCFPKKQRKEHYQGFR